MRQTQTAEWSCFLPEPWLPPQGHGVCLPCPLFSRHTGFTEMSYLVSIPHFRTFPSPAASSSLLGLLLPPRTIFTSFRVNRGLGFTCSFPPSVLTPRGDRLVLSQQAGRQPGNMCAGKHGSEMAAFPHQPPEPCPGFLPGSWD